MGKSDLLVTATEDLKELLGNGKTYSVPRYQRDYSWKQEHWEDLWEDLCGLDQQTSDHYMGAIVLQAEDRKTFKIIDGQQRVTTLSIFVLAAIDLLRTRAEGGTSRTTIGSEPSCWKPLTSARGTRFPCGSKANCG